MSNSVESVQAFILAENRLLREALTRILSKKSDIRVVGASAFSPDVVEQISSAAPDVLLSDSAAVALSDLRLVSEVRAAIPGLKVVMIGMDADPETFLRAVRDGIVGFVLKDASAMEVAAAVRSVANQEAVCPPSLCLALFERVANQNTHPTSFVIRHNLGLTRREHQLVQMISRGLTNKEIASQLNLSEQTVKNHVHRMLRKVGGNRPARRGGDLPRAGSSRMSQCRRFGVGTFLVLICYGSGRDCRRFMEPSWYYLQ